jgi:hypothetical protein
MARRDEGAYLQYVTEEQRSQPGWIGREGDRLSHSAALRPATAAGRHKPRLDETAVSGARSFDQRAAGGSAFSRQRRA